MRRIHLLVGLITALAFIGSGQIMAHHEPAMAALSNEVRLAFRSRHIYLLAGALLNMMLGTYLQLHPAGWRRVVQFVGSMLLLLAPALLLTAFLTEPEYGLHGRLRFSRGGIVAMALGTLAHLIGGVGRKMFSAAGEK